MRKTSILFIILLFISNCSLNKVINHHGVHNLVEKEKKLIIKQSNTNDIQKLLGPPSTKGLFHEDIFIYIERKTSTTQLSRLGKKKLLVNNVLIIEIDKKGLLAKKILLNKDQMNNINFSKDLTSMNYTKRSFIYNFLNSMRTKINDPLGKKK